MTNTAGQWHALIDGYGQHHRPVARSNVTVMAIAAGQWHALIIATVMANDEP